jgi:hypothetical protein
VAQAVWQDASSVRDTLSRGPTCRVVNFLDELLRIMENAMRITIYARNCVLLNG